MLGQLLDIVLNAVEVGRGYHHRPSWNADACQFPGGNRAAHEAHPMCGGKVRRDTGPAGNKRGVFEATDGASDPGHSGAAGAVPTHETLCSKARRTTARTRSRLYSALV